MNRKNIAILCAIASVAIMSSILNKKDRVITSEKLSDVAIKQEKYGQTGNIPNVEENNSDELVATNLSTSNEDKEETTNVENLSENNEMNQVAQGESKPENIKPSQVPGGESKPENTKPSQVPGGESKPENTKPSQVPVVESKPENTKPSQVPVVESKPENTKPSQVPVVESKPENTKPSQVPGVENKPENDKPNQVPGAEDKPENDKPNQVPGAEDKPENDKPNQVPDVENKPENDKPNQVPDVENKPENDKPNQVPGVENKPENDKPNQVPDVENKPENTEPNQDKANEVIKLINSLNSSISLSDIEAVKNARKAYNDLNENDKTLVTNIDKLINAEKEVARLEEKLEIDQATSKNVIDKIATLDKVITFDDAAKITNVRNEYDKLNAEAKALVTNFDILVKAENDLQNILNKIDNITKLINELPKNITLNDKDKVEKARRAYDDLSDINKKGVNSNIVSILEAAELKIAKLEEKLEIDQATSKNVIDKIATLDKVITFDDAAKITNVRNEYDKLNAEAKALVTNFDILVKAENDIQNILNKIDNVTKLINELPKNITLNDKDKVEKARRAYDNLSDVNKKGVNSNIVSILEAAELKIAKLEEKLEIDQATSKKVIDKIATLDKVITFDDAAKITNVRTEYDKLNAEAKALVTNLDILVKAENDLQNILNEIDNVTKLINELPKNITLNDKDKVEEARRAYNDLSDVNKKGVDSNIVSILEAAELEIVKLETLNKPNTNIEIIINKIDLLEDIITKDNVYEQKNKIEEITKLIYSISNKDKQQITNIDKIKSIRKKVQVMESDIRGAKKVEECIDGLMSVDRITLPFKIEVDNAREDYEALSNNAKALVDPNRVKKLEALENKMNELVDKISKSAKEVNELIAKLPDDIKKVNYTHEETIMHARFLFNRLSSDEKALVTNIKKLEDAEAEWNMLKNQKDKVVAIINNVPLYKDVTLADKQLLIDVRRVFEDADIRVQEHVFELNFGRLVLAEHKVIILEKLQDESESATRALIKKIEELTNTELTLEDKDAVLGLRDEFYKLPVDSRELIDFGYIQRLEIRISKLESASK